MAAEAPFLAGAAVLVDVAGAEVFPLLAAAADLLDEPALAVPRFLP